MVLHKKFVDKRPNMEPFGNIVVSEKIAESTVSISVYKELVSIVKESTTQYYNMRIILGLERA